FRGNAEGRDVREGAADVLVADGFTGNVVLKAVEGTIRTLLDALREEITASTTGTRGGRVIWPAPRLLPPRPARLRRDRARQLVGNRDRQRGSARRPRRRARRRRTPRCPAA